MSTTDPSNPTPRLKGSERLLLEHLRAHADADGCVSCTRVELAEALGMAASTMQLAVTGLEQHGLLTVARTTGGRANAYCLAPTDPPTDPPTGPTDSDRPTPTDSVGSLAGERTPPRSSPPLSPSHGVSGNLIPEGTNRPTDPTDRLDRPTDAVPIGRLAVAAATEAAAAAGRSVEAHLRGRIGSAAQRLSEEHDVEVILRAARRLGEGGYTDLYTAVRAVLELPQERTPPPAEPDRTVDLMPTGSTVRVSPRIEAVIRYVRGTWPRAVIDAEIWEDELGKVQERFLIAAVREIARSGDKFPPTWGEVYGKAREIGQPIVGAERAERARLREIERLG